MPETWKLKRTKQCDKCPWRKCVDPTEIPNGYDVEKHKALACTIAEPGDLRGVVSGSPISVMACHEEHEVHCLGWLMNQLGPGNNIGLRLHVRNCENVRQVKLRGPQRQLFEETLPEAP